MNRLTMDEHGACDLLSGRLRSTQSARGIPVGPPAGAGRAKHRLAASEQDVELAFAASAAPVSPKCSPPSTSPFRAGSCSSSSPCASGRWTQFSTGTTRSARRRRCSPASAITSPRRSHIRVDPTAVNRVVCHTFFATSVCCLLSCLHVIICTMYTCNWAPALALRGPSGSLTRAYKAVRGEKNQINAFFTVGIISFAVQTVCAVWILDETPKWTYDSIAATAVLGLAGIVIFWYHRRMHGRFFGDSAKLLDVDSDAVEEPPPPPRSRRRRRRRRRRRSSRSTLVASSAASAGPPPHRTRPRRSSPPTRRRRRARAPRRGGRRAQHCSITPSLSSTRIPTSQTTTPRRRRRRLRATLRCAASCTSELPQRARVGGWRRRSPRNGENGTSSSLAAICSTGGRRRTTRRGRRARSTTRSTSAASRCSATWPTRGGGLRSSRSSKTARARGRSRADRGSAAGVGAEARRRHADALASGR